MNKQKIVKLIATLLILSIVSIFITVLSVILYFNKYSLKNYTHSLMDNISEPPSSILIDTEELDGSGSCENYYVSKIYSTQLSQEQYFDFYEDELEAKGYTFIDSFTMDDNSFASRVYSKDIKYSVYAYEGYRLIFYPLEQEIKIMAGYGECPWG